MDRFLEYLQSLNARQRVALVLTGALAAAAVWGAVELANRVRYQVLFSNLEATDAASIVGRLEEQKVPYRIAAGGSAISIPAEQVTSVRLELAGEGLPRGGGVGFEIFDRTGYDVSDFVQNVNYQRAIERELGRTIENLNAVSRARVHLVLPARTLFAQESQEAKGSVVLKLHRGRDLRSEEILSIANLVSSGVRGLSPARVSIVDTDGRLLKDGQGDDSLRALTGHQLELTSTYERELERKLVTLLTPVVGEDRVRARVDATLDFESVQRVEETYDADGAVVRSEQKGRQKRSVSTGGGAPGTSSNLPTGLPVASAGEGESDESSDSVVSYEIPKTIATIVEPVGEVQRLTVAVVVDNAMRTVEKSADDPAAADAGGPPAVENVARTAEEMGKITMLAQAAIGIDESRGDVLTVVNVPFDTGSTASDTVAMDAAEQWDFWYRMVKYPSIVIGALLAWLLLVRPTLRSIRTVLTPLPAQGGRPALAQGSGGDIVQAEDVAPSLLLRRKMMELSSSEPEGAAEVIRAWIKEKSE